MGDLRSVQTQAEERVRLGMQLLKAADSRLNAQREVLAEVREEQGKLREQVQNDVAKSLQTYDQWMGKIDESFTRALRNITDRLETIEQQIGSKMEGLDQLCDKTQAVLAELDPSVELKSNVADQESSTPLMQTPGEQDDTIQSEAIMPVADQSDLPSSLDQSHDDLEPPTAASADEASFESHDAMYQRLLQQLRDGDAEPDESDSQAAA